MNIKITSQIETEAYLMQLSSSGKLDNQATIKTLSKDSVLSYEDISLDDEWWIYFKPTKLKEAEFQLQAWITLEDLPQS